MRCRFLPITLVDAEAHERDRRNNNPSNAWWIPASSSYRRSQISCGHPGTPNRGNSLFESVAAGSLVVHSCNAGHQLVGAKLRLCQSNGQWTPQLPKCVCKCVCICCV